MGGEGEWEWDGSMRPLSSSASGGAPAAAFVAAAAGGSGDAQFDAVFRAEVGVYDKVMLFGSDRPIDPLHTCMNACMRALSTNTPPIPPSIPTNPQPQQPTNPRTPPSAARHPSSSPAASGAATTHPPPPPIPPRLRRRRLCRPPRPRCTSWPARSSRARTPCSWRTCGAFWVYVGVGVCIYGCVGSVGVYVHVV